MVLIIPCGLWSVLERKPAEHAKYCHCSEHYSDHLTGTAAIIATSVGTVECLIYLCRALLPWPTSGGAQLLLASFPSLWQCSSPGSPGPCCCLLTGHSTFSQSTANGSEFTCVPAILHLEPRTLVLPFFISVSQTSLVLFQGASVCLDCIPTLQCQKGVSNPSCPTAAEQREVFLHRSKVGRGFMSRGVTRLCQKNTPVYMSFYQGSLV